MNRTDQKVLSSYRMLLRHYYEIGVGERSRFAGTIVTDNLIDTIQNRYKQLGYGAEVTDGLIDTIQNRYLKLGGRMKDLDNFDAEFDESE